MLLGLRTNGTVVDNGTARYSGRPSVDRDSGIHEVSVCVIVPDPLFGKLAGGAGYSVVMTFDARCRVENGTEPRAWIMSPFKLGLIEGEGVARRLCYPVADTLHAGSHS